MPSLYLPSMLAAIVACTPSHGPATPRDDACRSNVDEDIEREERQEASALDAALREQGFTRPTLGVDPIASPQTAESTSAAGTHAILAGDGSYRLDVGLIGGCDGQLPIIAMTETHEVFVVAPKIVPTHRCEITECSGSCRHACGMPMPAQVVFATVPADATLGSVREIRVPVDTQVTFHVLHQSPCNVP
jgi:hypothetical protein